MNKFKLLATIFLFSILNNLCLAMEEHEPLFIKKKKNSYIINSNYLQSFETNDETIKISKLLECNINTLHKVLKELKSDAFFLPESKKCKKFKKFKKSKKSKKSKNLDKTALPSNEPPILFNEILNSIVNLTKNNPNILLENKIVSIVFFVISISTHENNFCRPLILESELPDGLKTLYNITKTIITSVNSQRAVYEISSSNGKYIDDFNEEIDERNNLDEDTKNHLRKWFGYIHGSKYFCGTYGEDGNHNHYTIH